MIGNKTIILIVQRLFIFLVAYSILGLLLDRIISANNFINFFNFIFIIFLAIDIVFTTIFIIKDYGVLKLIIVIQNLLTKLMLIILAIAVLFTSVNDDGPVVYMYLNMILLGIVAYPTYIILFLIDTYKGVKIKVNWSLFIILTNGLVVYILGFLVETRYDSAEVSRHLTDFYFKYGMSFIYIPIVVALIIYVITLFKAPEELVEE